MSKFLAVLALCALLITGARLAPSVQDAIDIRIALARAPGVMLTQEASNGFSQLIINYIIEWAVNKAMGGAASSRIGSNDKSDAGSKELKQGELNYQAAGKASEVYADAVTTFSPKNLIRACRIMNEQKEAGNSLLNAHLEKKSLAANETLSMQSVASAAMVMRKRTQEHNAKYCSQESIDRGRCTELSSMPDADNNAVTIFAAEGSDTFSEEQRDAARSFMRNVTTPDPVESLPAGLEGTPGGKRFLIEQRANAAELSMAQAAFSRVLAARTPGTP